MKHPRTAALLAAAILSMPAGAEPQALPGGQYFVENNTGRALRCAFRRPPEEWQPWFTLEPGKEFTSWAENPGERALFYCTGQAEQRPYRLNYDTRHSILERPPGQIRLYRVNPDAG